MAVQIEEHPPLPAPERMRFEWLSPTVPVAGATLIVYLCWRLVMPFLTALSWAFALALIAEPMRAWMLRRRLGPTVAALIIIMLALAVVAGPGAILAHALAGEASDLVGRITNDAGTTSLREAIENNKVSGPVLRWLDSRFDLPKEAAQLARSLAGWASGTISSLFTGSIRLLSQLAVTVFVAFYFLRDNETILSKVRSLIPLPPPVADAIFSRIAHTIRVSLGGKMVVASIQGALGGLMFFWLGLPAPIFWGTVMAVLSIFPVIGAFIVWAPAALFFALQGDWRHALLLTGWGVLIIHPVDNLLGPVLVGTTLRLHTLLMFFSIIGGIAAFGASGLVLGPVTIAIAAGLMEFAERPSRGAANQ